MLILLGGPSSAAPMRDLDIRPIRHRGLHMDASCCQEMRPISIATRTGSVNRSCGPTAARAILRDYLPAAWLLGRSLADLALTWRRQSPPRCSLRRNLQLRSCPCLVRLAADILRRRRGHRGPQLQASSRVIRDETFCGLEGADREQR